MRRSNFVALVAVVSMLAACGPGGGGGGGQSPSTSSSQKPAQPRSSQPAAENQTQSDNQQQPSQQQASRKPPTEAQIPAPTPNIDNKTQIASILRPNPSDPIASLFTAFLTETSPDAVENIGRRLASEVYSDPDLKSPRFDELSTLVGDLGRGGAYGRESANRVAILEHQLQRESEARAYGTNTRDTAVIVAGSAVVGLLAGTEAWEYVPEWASGLRRQFGRLVDWSTDKSRKIYEGVRAGTPKLANKTIQAGKALVDADAWKSGGRAAISGVKSGTRSFSEFVSSTKNRVGEWWTDEAKISAPDSAFMKLQSLEVPGDLLGNLALRPTSRAKVVGVPFNATDIAGFRYAVLSEWDGVNLGDKRMVVYELRRLSLVDPATRFVVSDPMDAVHADSIAAKIASKDGPQSRTFAYVYEPKTSTFRAFRGKISQVGTFFSSLPGRARPLLSKVNWPTALGTTAGSSIVGLVFRNMAYEDGVESGADASNIDLEKQLPPSLQRAPVRSASR